MKFEKEDSLCFRAGGTVLVMCAHYAKYVCEFQENRLCFLLGKLGRYGVALFFLVSGYGVVQSIKDRTVDHHFLVRRIKNIYLPFIIMQILALIYIGKPADSMNWKDWLWYFSGVGYWYIVVIAVLYILFFISVRCFDKYREVVLVLLVTGLNAALMAIGCEEYWYLTNYVFCLGALYAWHTQAKPKSALVVSLLWGIGFIVSSVCYPAIQIKMPHDLLKISAALCFAGCVWSFYQWLPFSIRLRSVVVIGKCSLFIYVLHLQALSFLRLHGMDSFAAIVMSIAVVLAASVWLEKLVAKMNSFLA